MLCIVWRTERKSALFRRKLGHAQISSAAAVGHRYHPLGRPGASACWQFGICKNPLHECAMKLSCVRDKRCLFKLFKHGEKGDATRRLDACYRDLLVRKAIKLLALSAARQSGA